MKNLPRIFVIILVLLGASAGRGNDLIRYVSLQGSSQAPYTNWAMAATNLADCIDVTPDGGVVNVSSGRYAATRDISIVSKTMMITSVYGAAQTVYDGGGQEIYGLQAGNASVVHVNGMTLTNFIDPNAVTDCYPFGTTGSGKLCLESCVVGGCTGYDAGAIEGRVAGCLYATNCLIQGNTSTRNGMGGGAVSAIYAVEVVLDRCTFIDNSATGGGGGVNGKNLTITNCVFIGNSAYDGGAIKVYGGTSAVIYGCTIISNSTGVGGDGGGINVRLGAAAKVYNCEITYNDCQGYRGGGVFCRGDIHIENCLIAHNNTTFFASDAHGGGGVYFQNVGCTVRNCTVVSNVAAYNGGGILFNADPTGTVGIINSLVYCNTSLVQSATNYCSDTANAGWTNSLTAPLPTGPTIVNVLTVNPQLDGFRPANGSPCVNAGLYKAWMDTARDLDDMPRVDRFSELPDIGAYERHPMGIMFTTW